MQNATFRRAHPWPRLPAKRHLALSQGPDSDQTVLYFLLRPLSPEIVRVGPMWGSSQGRCRPSPGKRQKGPGQAPPDGFAGDLCHPSTFRCRQAAPAPSALNWVLGQGAFRCPPLHATLPLHRKPLWAGLSSLGSKRMSRGGSCPPRASPCPRNPARPRHAVGTP